MVTVPPSFSSASFAHDEADDELVRTREERVEVSLPARLIRPVAGMNDEVIPVILTNVSASGLQIVTDQRFSLHLPPFLGARFTIEFFFDSIEIRHVNVEIVRSEKRQGYRVLLGCKFTTLPTQARLALRAAVAARRASAGHV
ncbi:MAG: PilZ domain-containing protein [Deltaproteobacteria bacterium]|nr:PilZ domain-containing protein [Deltaproteobacteria bacterium]